MNFRRQSQAVLAGWQARGNFGHSDEGCGRWGNGPRGMSFKSPLALTPHECPARVGGMAGEDENKNRVCIRSRLNFR